MRFYIFFLAFALIAPRQLLHAKTPCPTLTFENTAVTQSRQVRFIMDSLGFFIKSTPAGKQKNKILAPVSTQYYILVTVETYGRTVAGSSFQNVPLSTNSVLYKQFMGANDTVLFLTNLEITPAINLNNVSRISVKTELIRADPENKIIPIINKMIDSNNGNIFAFGGISDLLHLSTSSSDSVLVCLKEFDIPLNPAAYKKKAEESANSRSRLLTMNKCERVPIAAGVYVKQLASSTAGDLLSALGMVANGVIGLKDFSEKHAFAFGVMEFHVTEDFDFFAPPKISKLMKNVVELINDNQLDGAREALGNLDEMLKTYLEVQEDQSAGKTDDQIFISNTAILSVKAFERLAITYIEYKKFKTFKERKKSQPLTKADSVKIDSLIALIDSSMEIFCTPLLNEGDRAFTAKCKMFGTENCTTFDALILRDPIDRYFIAWQDEIYQGIYGK